MARTMIGPTIRRLRHKRGLSQQGLAAKLGISASYLNLLEHDQRGVTASLLIKLTRTLDVPLEALSGNEERLLELGVREALSDPLLGLDPPEPAEFTEVAARPQSARAIIALHRALRVARQDAAGIALPSGRRILLPTEEARQLYQDRGNYFGELEEIAESVRASMAEERGENPIVVELTPSEMNHAVAERLRRRHGLVVKVAPLDGMVRSYDPGTRLLVLSDVLRRESRGFHMAFQLLLIEAGELVELMMEEIKPSSPEAATLIRIGLVNYAAAALLMPYGPFLEAAAALRYDVDVLAARFSVSFEQAAHRLSTLQRPEQRGVPIFFLRLDAASNITKSFSNAGFPIAQHGGSCARWIGNTALATPGLVRVQLGQLPDGATYLCVARTVTSSTMGWNDVPPVHVIVIGCERERAAELIYSDGIDLPNAVQRIGTSCRLCDWPDCRSRAFPPLAHRLTLDPHQRGLTRYPFERD
jgi:predicted transcriptional regulator/DNA-binding XRE family transcriptional regulator